MNHLTDHGVMREVPLRVTIYRCHPRGPDAIFSSAQVEELVAVLDRENTAIAVNPADVATRRRAARFLH